MPSNRLITILQQGYHRIITKQLQISLAMLLYLLIWYTLLRLGFFIFNHQFFRDAGSGDIIRAFIYGLRFDISALLMINGLFLLLYNFPVNLTRLPTRPASPAGRRDWSGRSAGQAGWKWIKMILTSLFYIINILFIALNLADYEYFPTIQRRLMDEIYTILPDIVRTIPSMLFEYYYLFIFLIILGFAFIFISVKLFNKLDKLINYSYKPLREIGCFIGLTLLMVIGIRGGLQSRPIRQAHAFFSTNHAVGYLVLNSSFTIIRSISQSKLTQLKFLPEDKAKSRVETMFRSPDETMLDPQYPFLRKKNQSGHQQKFNLVIFIMESWTADYIGSIRGGTDSATPFFDSLTLNGTLFTNFLATGQRSQVATASILTSIPGFFSDAKIGGARRSIIGSQSELDNFLGLGTILLKHGYKTTSFHHGAKTGSMGFDAYARLAGFRRYFGKENFPNITHETAGDIWGIWDEEFFLDVVSKIDVFQPPFCSIVFSLTSHAPYEIPPHRQALFQKYSQETPFKRVLRYSDYSLQKFFETACTKPWFKDTIFIITGDHTNFSTGNNFRSCFNVPLLLYAPGIIKPQRLEQIGAQVDILPTILNLLEIPVVHASMGRSLFDTHNPRYAVVTEGSHYGIFSDRFVLINDLEKNIGLYDYHLDPFFKTNLMEKYPDIATDLKEALYAYIQEASYAISHNRICRDIDLK